MLEDTTFGTYLKEQYLLMWNLIFNSDGESIMVRTIASSSRDAFPCPKRRMSNRIVRHVPGSRALIKANSHLSMRLQAGLGRAYDGEHPVPDGRRVILGNVHHVHVQLHGDHLRNVQGFTPTHIKKLQDVVGSGSATRHMDFMWTPLNGVAPASGFLCLSNGGKSLSCLKPIHVDTLYYLVTISCLVRRVGPNCEGWATA
jgi:hypothetical protein